MKKLLVLLISVTVCAVAAAQETGSEVGTNLTLSELSQKLDATMGELSDLKSLYEAKSNEVHAVPLNGKNWKKRGMYVYPVLEICTGVSSNKAKADTEMMSLVKVEDAGESTTSFALEFGGGFTFVPGKVVGDSLVINPYGFAFNTSFLTSFCKSDNYDMTCDFLGKIGVELGNGHAFGFGVDALGGYGKGIGDFVLFNPSITDPDATTTIHHYTEWCWEFGGQVWFRTGILSKALTGLEVLTFARLVWSVDPGDVKQFSQVHANFFKKENWSFGVSFRYKI